MDPSLFLMALGLKSLFLLVFLKIISWQSFPFICSVQRFFSVFHMVLTSVYSTRFCARCWEASLPWAPLPGGGLKGLVESRHGLALICSRYQVTQNETYIKKQQKQTTTSRSDLTKQTFNLKQTSKNKQHSTGF